MGDGVAVAEQLVALLDSGLDELLISNLVRGDHVNGLVPALVHQHSFCDSLSQG